MERLPPSGIDVLVVGAGIGGLGAAVELWRKGHDVRVIEAKETIDVIGDFIGIGVSGTRQFEKWPGSAERYDEICYKPAMSMYTYHGELLVGPFPAQKVDAIPTPVSRPKLVNFLYDVVISLGISVTFGQRVTEYYEDRKTSKAGVYTTSGTRYEADLVVAADGVGSKSSKLTLGNDSRPKSSGFAVYRTAFPTRVAHASKEVASYYPILGDGNDDIRMYLGPDTHAITVISKDITTWLLTHKDRGDAAESWSTTVNAEDVIREIAKDVPWDPRLLELIKQTPKNRLVIQLGDAAHSFLPTSANGGTQAMEDAITLASCLDLAGKDNIPLATKVHYQFRFQRVSCCQRSGFKNRELWHNTDFELAKKHPERLADMTGKWITSHDPEAYVYQNWAKCVNNLAEGTDFVNTNLPPGYKYKPWTIEECMKAADEGKKLEDDGDWR